MSELSKKANRNYNHSISTRVDRDLDVIGMIPVYMRGGSEDGKLDKDLLIRDRGTRGSGFSSIEGSSTGNIKYSRLPKLGWALCNLIDSSDIYYFVTVEELNKFLVSRESDGKTYRKFRVVGSDKGHKRDLSRLADPERKVEEIKSSIVNRKRELLRLAEKERVKQERLGEG